VTNLFCSELGVIFVLSRQANANDIQEHAAPVSNRTYVCKSLIVVKIWFLELLSMTAIGLKIFLSARWNIETSIAVAYLGVVPAEVWGTAVAHMFQLA